MKKLAKFFLYFTLIMGAIGFMISLSVSQFPVLETGSKGYFLALKNKHYNEAYDYMSTTYKKANDFDKFIRDLKQIGLYDVQSWEPGESILNKEENAGVIRGIVNTKVRNRNYRVKVEVYFRQDTESEELLAKHWVIDSIVPIEEVEN